MNLFFVLFGTVCLFTFSSCSTTVERPRGVSLTNKVFYDSSVDFTCLDGSKTISFGFVNDDYCDCPDGSDEPGTSACPNSNFHCKNKGYKSKSIPSSRVNDGICDCCDGSDEWKTPGLCINTCLTLNKADMEIREMESRVQNQGKQLREQYSKTGISVKAERENELKETEKKLLKITEELDEATKLKEEIEKKENELKEKHHQAAEAARKIEEEKKEQQDSKAAFSEMDLNHDGILTISEIILHKELDPDTTDNEFTEVEATEILTDVHIVKESFYVTVWPKIKGSFKSSLEIKMPPPPPINDEANSDDATPAHPPTETDVIEDYDEEGSDLEDDETEDEEEPPLTESIESHKEINVPTYDEETLKVIEQANEKRKVHDDISKHKQGIEADISRLKKKLELDFGEDHSFQVLEGKCFDLKTLEYKYSLCPFDKTTQAPVKGGSSTNLGKWGRWSGPPDDKYSKMKFEHGLACWNGPSRSTEVVISCGNENKLVSVDEPSRCSYLFEFITPCACAQNNHDSHDEL